MRCYFCKNFIKSEHINSMADCHSCPIVVSNFFDNPSTIDWVMFKINVNDHSYLIEFNPDDNKMLISQPHHYLRWQMLAFIDRPPNLKLEEVHLFVGKILRLKAFL